MCTLYHTHGFTSPTHPTACDSSQKSLLERSAAMRRDCVRWGATEWRRRLCITDRNQWLKNVAWFKMTTTTMIAWEKECARMKKTNLKKINFGQRRHRLTSERLWLSPAVKKILRSAVALLWLEPSTAASFLINRLTCNTQWHIIYSCG